MTYITVNNDEVVNQSNKAVYLTTNGVHLDIIIPYDLLEIKLKNPLKVKETDTYVAFGWGDENFYIHTPTWGDLTFNNAFGALFLKSTTLMHVTRYSQVHKTWSKVYVSSAQLEKLNAYILSSFKKDTQNDILHVPDSGYSRRDTFYKANGSYSCFKTCNSWANSAFKESNLKACFWTPFDFGLIHKYE
ncbi:TIGR02117 family protein [Aquimarina addita]|uniref:TIGR02117 family protein n=2 Tax=Aquimarina addita TaxID=870485 RepID=A0ABP7XFQ5_9FLAO